MSGTERAAILRRVARAIEADKDRLARIEVADNGKPLPEAIWNIKDAAGCFEFYAGMSALAEAVGDVTSPGRIAAT